MIADAPQGAARQLRRHLAGPRQEPAWPEGVREARFRPERDLDDVHRLLVSAYPPNKNPFSSLRSWRRWLTSDPEYSPEAIFLARSTAGELLGVCQCWTSAFIKDLAVAPGQRRRGIGEALLMRSFAYFAGKGARFVDLKVKIGNPTGAERLYKKVGMVEVYSEWDRTQG